MVVPRNIAASRYFGFLGVGCCSRRLVLHLVLVATVMKSFLVRGAACLNVLSLFEKLVIRVLIERAICLIIDGDDLIFCQHRGFGSSA